MDARQSAPCASSALPPAEEGPLLDELARVLGSPVPVDVVPTGLASDSRRVEPGYLYVALPGCHVHGIAFEAEAARRGASAMVSDRAGSVLPTVVVEDPRATLGDLAAALHGRPSELMDVVGITGTNGKTTTAFLTHHLLEQAGRTAGRITTIDMAWDDEAYPSVRTTPEAPELQLALARMRHSRCDAAVIEVSSHGLALGRVNGVRFAVGVFTNLGRDHYDFHGDRETYLRCKASLFQSERCGVGIVNLDDPAGRQVAGMATCPVVTVSAGGSRDADWRVTGADFGPVSTRFEVAGPCGSFEAVLPMIGRHNLANALAALAACHQLGARADPVGLVDFAGVPGRLERVDAGQPFVALVDFAHNPEAVAAAFEAVRSGVPGRVIALVGAPGDRDPGKRPLMRHAAASADVVIVTTDDPYNEDPQAIIADMMFGADADRRHTEFIVEPDRASAIARAVRIAGEGDAVLVTGRGHEIVQTFGSREVPFDDRQHLRREIRAAAASASAPTGASHPGNGSLRWGRGDGVGKTRAGGGPLRARRARRGLIGPARSLVASGAHAAQAAQQRVFERYVGVSTAGNVYPKDGVAVTGRVFYEGCQWIPVRRSLRRLHPGRTDMFVDLGAGKGQALLVAARCGFGRVLGVECDPELAKSASQNVERARSRLRVPDVEVVNADALEWEIPDEMSVMFMFCPFVGELFHSVLGKVFASYDRRPRDLFVVYSFPFEHNWLVSSGRVVVDRVLPARWPAPPGWWRTSWVIVTYRIVAADESPGRRRTAGRGRPARRWGGTNGHGFWIGEPGAEKVYSRAPATLDRRDAEVMS